MVTRPRPEDLVDNVIRFQKAAFAGTGLDSTLAPPATEEEMEAVEEQLGFSLPEELKTLYRFCAGGLPLGSEVWYDFPQLVEYSEWLNDHRRSHYHLREKYPYKNEPATTFVDEGPGHRPIVAIQKYPGSSVLLEVDQDGLPGRVWSYNAHQVDAPFRLFANSLGEYWANLAFLAEAGCYRASFEGHGKNVSVFIERMVALDKKYEAGLPDLDLTLVRYYP